MTERNNRLADVIVEAVRREALGPDWRQQASAWPLVAAGGVNEREHWDMVDRLSDVQSLRSRAGNPTITVWNNQNRSLWVASVMVSPTGKNPVIAYTPDALLVPVAGRTTR